MVQFQYIHNIIFDFKLLQVSQHEFKNACKRQVTHVKMVKIKYSFNENAEAATGGVC